MLDWDLHINFSFACSQLPIRVDHGKNEKTISCSKLAFAYRNSWGKSFWYKDVAEEDTEAKVSATDLEEAEAAAEEVAQENNDKNDSKGKKKEGKNKEEKSDKKNKEEKSEKKNQGEKQEKQDKPKAKSKTKAKAEGKKKPAATAKPKGENILQKIEKWQKEWRKKTNLVSWLLFNRCAQKHFTITSENDIIEDICSKNLCKI